MDLGIHGGTGDDRTAWTEGNGLGPMAQRSRCLAQQQKSAGTGDQQKNRPGVAMLLDHEDGIAPANQNSRRGVSDEKRQDERFYDPKPGTVRHTGRSSKVLIRNLSARGAMADGIFDISIGQFVSVRIGSGGWVPAKVAWAVGPRCGLEFQSAVDPASIP